MIYRVVFSPESEEQLVALYYYIAEAASPEIAVRYTEGISNSLQVSPHRGTLRNDIRPGLRVTNYKKRAMIAYAVIADQVSILGIYYGGQDYESILEISE